MTNVWVYGTGCVVRGEGALAAGRKEGKSEATMWAFPQIFTVLLELTQIHENIALL